MKRCFQNISNETDTEEAPKNKVVLVEREPEPGGIALVNPLRTSKKTHLELMELGESLHTSESFIQANAKNKLDIIGKQMKNLHVLMNEVVNETKLHNDLNNAACNFVKKPGHVYHLYEKPSGQKYFGMLSPHEWINVPHHFLGSFRLEVDFSWTPAGQEETRYEGLNFLKDIYSNSSGMKAISNSDS
ncbi:uncharacterized protein C1orf50 homolog [Anoplophora glabripennis]|nr:uncharacterized protein C1orf50 homolog [Anoplophora glabripennis]